MHERFLTASASVMVVAALGPAAGAILGGESLDFVGSMIVSSGMALAFAAYTLQHVRNAGRGSFAAATLAAVLGLWFVYAPSIYDPGVIAKGAAHASGAVLAAFGAFVALDTLEHALHTPGEPNE